MMTIILEAALRSFVLGALLWLVLKTLRIKQPQLERNVWITALIAAYAMPWIMQLDLFAPTIAPALPWNSYVEAVTASSASTGFSLSTLLLASYGTVAGILIVREIVGLVRAWILRRTSITLDRVLDLRSSAQVRAPATVFSTVIVPETFQSWPSEQQRAAIAHERSHVMSGDFYLQQLARLHRAVFWFSPFSWWLVRRLSILNEHISDDAALRVMPQPASYAEFLLGFAQCATNDEHAVAMARPTTLIGRVERILSDRANPRPPHVAKKIAALTALSTLVVLVAGVNTSVANDVAPVKQAAARQEASAARTSAGNGIVLPRSNAERPLSQPVYPPPSRRLHEAGTVVLQLLVLPNGRVSDAVVHKSSGFIELDNAARYESFRWQLDPGSVNGTPTSMWGKFAVTFKLNQ